MTGAGNRDHTVLQGAEGDAAHADLDCGAVRFVACQQVRGAEGGRVHCAGSRHAEFSPAGAPGVLDRRQPVCLDDLECHCVSDRGNRSVFPGCIRGDSTLLAIVLSRVGDIIFSKRGYLEWSTG